MGICGFVCVYVSVVCVYGVCVWLYVSIVCVMVYMCACDWYMYVSVV